MTDQQPQGFQITVDSMRELDRRHSVGFSSMFEAYCREMNLHPAAALVVLSSLIGRTIRDQVPNDRRAECLQSMVAVMQHSCSEPVGEPVWPTTH